MNYKSQRTEKNTFAILQLFKMFAKVAVNVSVI